MLSPGTTLGGRYRLDERIAGGGMGDVWRGTDEVLGRTVAVKVLLPALLEEPGFAERFRGEARTMATINHPGVVDVYDYGSEGGTAFLIMEYVEGDALSRTLSRVGRLTPARTMALLAQAADALHAAHDKGIVHRDVKPGNLLVRPNGTLVLTDFGIARSAMVGQLTAAGSVLGTASYISPEQASGATATPLSDVYALGVVAYQCLSGRRPFEGDNPLEIAMRHVRDTPPPLPADIPPSVRGVVEKAMAKDPAARFPSAAALAQVARRTSGQLSGGGTTSAPIPTGAVSGPPSPTGPSPISGPPISPPLPPMSPVSGMSGPPGSPVSAQYPGMSPVSPAGSPFSPPATGPVSAGGTRIMPGAVAGPHPPTGPTHSARGAAGVAPPPPPSDTGYTFVAPQPRPAPRSSGGNRNVLMLAAVVLGVLVVLVCGGAGVWYLTSDDRPGGNPGSTPGGAATTQGQSTAPVDTKDIPCDKLRNRPLSVVKKNLEDNRFKVNVEYVEGAIPNQVVDVSPCGRQPVGSTITVKVVKSALPPDRNTPSRDPAPSGPTASCVSPVPGTNLCLESKGP
jgi:eukaryotic-like serine/threonine-protein kinase